MILGAWVGNIKIGQKAGSILQNRPNIQQDQRRRHENEMAWGPQAQRIFFVKYVLINACKITSFPFFFVFFFGGFEVFMKKIENLKN